MPIIYVLAASYFLGTVLAAGMGLGLWPCAGGALAALACMALNARRRRVLFMAGLCAAGFFVAVFMRQVDDRVYEAQPMHRLVRSHGGELVRLWGVAMTVPEKRNGRVRFDMKVTHARTFPSRRKPCRGRVRVLLDDAPPNLEPGRRVSVEGTLSGLESLNPEAGAVLRAQDVAGYLFAHRAAPVRVTGRAPAFPPFLWGAALRARFNKVLETHVDEPYRNVLGRMTLGRAQPVPPELYDQFRDAGVVHVLVVSGMHVSLLLGIFLGLAYLWGRNRWITFAVLGLMLLVFYAMAGGGPSVTRAVIMGGVLLCAFTLGRDYNALPALCWAALALMIMNPHIVSSVGAQLSFLACLGIIILYPVVSPYAPPGPWWKPLRWFLISICAQAPLYPAIAWHFHRVSLVSPISNIFVVPLMLASLPAALLLCVLGSAWSGFAVVLAPIARGLAWLMVTVVKLFAAVPQGAVVVARPALWEIALYAVAAGGAFLYVRLLTQKRASTAVWRLMAAGMAGGLLAWSFVLAPRDRDMRITFLDVNQGDSALIEAPCGRGRAPVRILVDGGSGPAPGRDRFNAGERVVGRYLYSRGITRLDAVVLSHAEEDHLNGLLWVLENVHVGRVVDTGFDIGEPAYAQFRRIIRRRRIPFTRGREGLALAAGSCLRMDFIHPSPHHLSLGELNPNNISLVFRLRFGDKSALFTGDAEQWAEHLLAEKYGPRLRADVLKAAHHGSATSSTRWFLRTVRPELAVISAGRHNMYGHPHPAVLARLRKQGVRVLRTDLHGHVTVTLPPAGGAIHTRTQFHPKPNTPRR